MKLITIKRNEPDLVVVVHIDHFYVLVVGRDYYHEDEPVIWFMDDSTKMSKSFAKKFFQLLRKHWLDREVIK